MDLDVNEFFDIYRSFHPDTTREEFEREWEKFMEYRRQMLEKQVTQ